MAWESVKAVFILLGISTIVTIFFVTAVAVLKLITPWIEDLNDKYYNPENYFIRKEHEESLVKKIRPV